MKVILKCAIVALFYSHGGGGRVREHFEKFFGKIGDKVEDTVESKGTPDEDVLSKCREPGRKIVGEARK